MREIKEETYNLLKSQNMLAQNKYNYALKLEGVETYGPIIGTLNNRLSNISKVSAAIHNISFVIRNDGKVLVTYGMGTNIYLLVLDHEEDLQSITDVVQGGTLFENINYSSVVDDTAIPMRLQKLKNGKILFYVMNWGTLNNIPWSVKIYESASGLGNDFVLKSTIYSYTRAKEINNNDRIGLSEPLEDENGDLYIAYHIPQFTDFNIALYGNIRLSKSTNGGVSWTTVFTEAFSQGQLAYRACGTFLLKKNQDILLGHIYDASTDYYRIHYSANNGATWNIFSSFMKNGFEGHSTDFLCKHFNLAEDKAGNLFLLASYTDTSKVNLYKYKGENYALGNIQNSQNWEKVISNINILNISDSNKIIITPKGTIHIIRTLSDYKYYDFAVLREEYSAPLNAISINISKGRGGSNTLNIAVDNANGRLNPNNPDSDLYGIIGLNKQVILKQGYGEELVEVFTGLIDSFDMKSFPHVMDISCRDLLKMALDQTVTELSSHTLYFENQPLETIFSYLCYLAGLETGEIEATGINITKEFSWQSYADAFQFLADLASFEYGADEYGKIYFRRDFQPDDLAIAYTFEEGQDITSLQYQLSDADLFAKVVVYGKSGEDIIAYEAQFLDAAKYNILPQKIMKIDATEASTIGELQKIANRAIYLMNSRTAVVRFSAIAVPWLQIGDFIQVNETSSRSAGIYRIVNMSLKMDDKSFLMDLECYYYGDSINPGTLPEDTATQTPNASLNLIPEMTSNTTPQGVARASSVLALYNNDYQPWNAFNSTSDDLYWNASAAYGWIEYQFAEKTIIDKYMLKARQDTTYNKAMPKNWTFEAFDGEKWIVLDTKTNQINWGVHEERSYNFTNATAYSKYRLNVSANNGYTRLQLEQLAMYYRGGV